MSRNVDEMKTRTVRQSLAMLGLNRSVRDLSRYDGVKTAKLEVCWAATVDWLPVLLELPIKELSNGTGAQVPHAECLIAEVQDAARVTVATLQIADGARVQNSLAFVANVEWEVRVPDDQNVGLDPGQIFLELLRQAVAGGILKYGCSVVGRSGVGQ